MCWCRSEERRVARDNWLSVLNRYKQGDRVPVSVRRFQRPMELTIELGDPEFYDYRIEEIPNASAQAKMLRALWLDKTRQIVRSRKRDIANCISHSAVV